MLGNYQHTLRLLGSLIIDNSVGPQHIEELQGRHNDRCVIPEIGLLFHQRLKTVDRQRSDHPAIGFLRRVKEFGQFGPDFFH